MIYNSYLNGAQNNELLYSLMQRTKSDEISWVELLEIKRYLENDNISIDRIRWLHRYLRHLQAARFIALQSSTYVTAFQSKIVILARSKYSGVLRLDWMENRSRTMAWHKFDASNVGLMRLQQLIENAGVSNSRSEIENILYSTDYICV